METNRTDADLTGDADRRPAEVSCALCGSRFVRRRRDARFCSPVCRAEASRERRGADHPATVPPVPRTRDDAAAVRGELARLREAAAARFAHVDRELARLREDIPAVAERIVEPVHDRLDRLRPEGRDDLVRRVAELEATVRQLRAELARTEARALGAEEAAGALVGALVGE